MSNIDNKRKMFERWAESQGYSTTRHGTLEEPTYASDTVRIAWQGWLARAQSDKAVSVEALEELAEHFDNGGWRTGVDYVNAMMEAAQQIRALIAKETGNG